MKQIYFKIRSYMGESLRRQLEFYLFVWVLLPMTLVTVLLFLEAREEMKEQALIHVRQRSLAIGLWKSRRIFIIFKAILPKPIRLIKTSASAPSIPETGWYLIWKIHMRTKRK